MVLCYVSWRLFETYDDVAQSLQHSAYNQNLTEEYCLALALFFIISHWPFSLIFVSKEEAYLKGTPNDYVECLILSMAMLNVIELNFLILCVVAPFYTYNDVAQLLQQSAYS